MVQSVSFTLPAFGSLIPGQGGRLAAIMRGAVVDGVEQPPYALLISAHASNEAQIPWAYNYSVSAPGATSLTDGLANTEEMLKGRCDAAGHIRNNALDGNGDWYLPSIGEMRVLRANVMDLLGTPTSSYWTSTVKGSQPVSYMVDSDRVAPFDQICRNFVRPVRRVPLTLLTPKAGAPAATDPGSNVKPVAFVLPPFGTAIPGQGGKLVAILRGPVVNGVEQPPHALLISDGDGNESDRSWGSPANIKGNANSFTDGLANTEAMLTGACLAALCVREKPIDGHADWYLPSICEISATAVNVPESLTKANCYWSSTYQGYNTACNYRFALETANTSADVSSIRRVRPFRRIPLGLLHA